VPILPALVLPPRPPELPTVPPPVTADKPPDFKRNDAFLSRWIEDFERVMKDAWLKLNEMLQKFHDRITALEQRVADTYTFGQKGALALAVPVEGAPPSLDLIALPLRVVRDEEVVEATLTAEVAPAASCTVAVEHVVPDAAGSTEGRPATTVCTLTLPAGGHFVSFSFTLPAPPPARAVAPPPYKVKKNSVLRAHIVGTGGDAEGAGGATDVVCQVRCR